MGIQCRSETSENDRMSRLVKSRQPRGEGYLCGDVQCTVLSNAIRPLKNYGSHSKKVARLNPRRSSPMSYQVYFPSKTSMNRVSHDA